MVSARTTEGGGGGWVGRGGGVGGGAGGGAGAEGGHQIVTQRSHISTAANSRASLGKFSSHDWCLIGDHIVTSSSDVQALTLRRKTVSSNLPSQTFWQVNFFTAFLQLDDNNFLKSGLCCRLRISQSFGGGGVPKKFQSLQKVQR